MFVFGFFLEEMYIYFYGCVCAFFLFLFFVL